MQRWKDLKAALTRIHDKIAPIIAPILIYMNNNNSNLYCDIIREVRTIYDSPDEKDGQLTEDMKMSLTAVNNLLSKNRRSGHEHHAEFDLIHIEAIYGNILPFEAAVLEFLGDRPEMSNFPEIGFTYGQTEDDQETFRELLEDYFDHVLTEKFRKYMNENQEDLLKKLSKRYQINFTK